MAEKAKYIDVKELSIILDTMKNPDSEFATDDYIDGFSDGISAAIKELEAFPTADVVPVVRCKDCVHYSNNNLKSQLDRLGYCLLNEEITDDKREPSDFCSYGERKGNENG